MMSRRRKSQKNSELKALQVQIGILIYLQCNGCGQLDCSDLRSDDLAETPRLHCQSHALQHQRRPTSSFPLTKELFQYRRIYCDLQARHQGYQGFPSSKETPQPIPDSKIPVLQPRWKILIRYGGQPTGNGDRDHGSGRHEVTVCILEVSDNGQLRSAICPMSIWLIKRTTKR